jgi:hypothetical protein
MTPFRNFQRAPVTSRYICSDLFRLVRGCLSSTPREQTQSRFQLHHTIALRLQVLASKRLGCPR